MVDFIKLTRMNAMGKEVGPVFVNKESIVALSPSINGSKMTDVTTGSSALLLVKESPEEIIQGFVVQTKWPEPNINENKS
jgi:hypothetical protein